MDSKEKFTIKSEIYDIYRPNYSEQFIGFIIENHSLDRLDRVADVGAGTGILTNQLLRIGSEIFAVEPNCEMRQIAENKFFNDKNIYVVNGSAEKTSLENNSIDLVVVAQAFHWFDVDGFKNEFHRISRNNKAILVWNVKNESQPYLIELENVNRKYCESFKGFSGGADKGKIACFFDHKYNEKVFVNNIKVNKDGFLNGVLTGSYTPNKNDEFYSEYVEKVEGIFHKYCVDDKLTIENDTIAFYN